MISIAMTYFERFELLRNTLRSISHYTHPDEIIIVDDASIKAPLSQSIVDTISYGMNVKLFRFSVGEKTWCNPCVPFNKAFSLCSGDTIIIQNAECYYNNDIVKYCQETDFENKYVVFGCYSLPKDSNPESHIVKDKSVTFDGDDGWYQHSKFRKTLYHFTTAISRKNLYKIQGFDESYANGVGYDDNEFLYRILTANLDIEMCDSLYTFHQYHYNGKQNHSTDSIISNVDKYRMLVQGNYNEFKSTLKEN